MRNHELDPLIHAPTQLAIVSLLAAVDEADFSFIRDQLNISDSMLSKHASTLETATYVEARKGYVGKRQLIPHGHEAFRAYLSTLQHIIHRTPTSDRTCHADKSVSGVTE